MEKLSKETENKLKEKTTRKTLSNISDIELREISKNIKDDLNKCYLKLNLHSNQFSSEGFTIKKENNKIFVNIPFLSTSKNEMFLKKLFDSSKEVILKHLKKWNRKEKI